VDGFLTVGQSAAVAAVHAMLGSHVPHAVVFAGPASVGKMTLAMDLAAGLLCSGAAGAGRPCRACRTCRMVEHGNHPDLHLLAPSGDGNQIRIGAKDEPEPGTVRRLVIDLALMPVEGGERVAIVRDAHRMNEAAQSAFLKTLEEPPAATTILLLADDEEQLLPTIRSRSARIRLGTVGSRDSEQLLVGRGLADAPTAARLARLAGGRPGLAVAYARNPEAERIRLEIARMLLDLLGRRASDGLLAAKSLLGSAMELNRLLATPVLAAVEPPKGRGRGRAKGASAVPATGEDGTDGSSDAADEESAGSGRKTSAADRRRALAAVLEAWRDVARDLAIVQRGAGRSVRQVAMLEELQATAGRVRPDAVAGFVAGLIRADELLAGNASPELVLDVLLVRWASLGRTP
jgi:DNA polymerase III delta' subunit